MILTRVLSHVRTDTSVMAAAATTTAEAAKTEDKETILKKVETALCDYRVEVDRLNDLRMACVQSGKKEEDDENIGRICRMNGAALEKIAEDLEGLIGPRLLAALNESVILRANNERKAYLPASLLSKSK